MHKLHGCQVQIHSASKATQSLVADEKVMQAEIIRLKEVRSISDSCTSSLHEVRKSLSDILETHYVSVQISRVARLHEEIITTMVACGVHIQVYNEAGGSQI